MQGLAVPGEIVCDIAVPSGWEIADGITDAHSEEDRANTELLKKKISTQFPVIADTVERYIADTYDVFDILITNAVIAIHADATFHILLLVNQEDFFSPRLNAAKLQAKEVLTTIGNMSMQYKFVSAVEYHKSYQLQHSQKLRYSFETPMLENVFVLH